MTTIEGWDVLDEEAGVLTREYAFRKGAMARMMTARADDGSLVVISPASGLDDAALRALERFGKVGALVAPNGFHYLGVPSWAAAFPEATVHAPPAAAKRIARKLDRTPAFQSVASLAARMGKHGQVHDLPGIKIGESWLVAKTRGGPVWYVGDSYFNMPALPPGLFGLVFRLTRSAPGFRLNGLGLKAFVNDKRAYFDAMEAHVRGAAPQRVVTAHGPVVETPDLADAMCRQIAERR